MTGKEALLEIHDIQTKLWGIQSAQDELLAQNFNDDANDFLEKVRSIFGTFYTECPKCKGEGGKEIYIFPSTMKFEQCKECEGTGRVKVQEDEGLEIFQDEGGKP